MISTVETTSEFETTTSATESTITVTQLRIGPCNPDPCENDGKCSETGSKAKLKNLSNLRKHSDISLLNFRLISNIVQLNKINFDQRLLFVTMFD